MLRKPGILYQERDNGEISNLYDFKVINKSTEPIDLEIVVINPEEGRIEYVGNPSMNPDIQELSEGSFFLYLKEDLLTGSNTQIEFGVSVNGELEQTFKSGFNGPRK
jgi:hypothetical protein